MIASPVPRATLLHVVKSMPSAPQILARIGHLLLDMDSELEDITGLIKRDPSITARIIRISNSAAYNTGTPFASIEEALARVGLTEVYRLTGFAAIAQVADSSLTRYRVSGAEVRENSLLTALVMEALARPAGVDARAAYTAGLLRSIGKIALDRLTRDRAYDGGRGIVGPLAEWETGFIGLNNCEAAAIILEEWRFSEETIKAILDHYLPGEGDSLAFMLNLAAGAAERCGHRLPGELSYWSVTPEKLAAAGVTQEELDDAMRLGLERFGPVRAALG
ncbi:MAG: HDOD domain-containing protein [Verrucomicrobia bacterium]|nr:HDOD domain-containing protein [Verrucomicrobiota bacterium]